MAATLAAPAVARKGAIDAAPQANDSRAMSLDAAMTRMPRPHDPERGEEALKHLPPMPPPLSDLVRGAAGCSPYLAALVEKEADWLPEALGDPEASLAAEIAAVDGLEQDADVAVDLRRAKRRIALLLALADLGGAMTLEQVTGTLTEFADTACRTALRTALAPLIARGKLPGMDEDALDNAGGLVVLAMGKMGAGELNYSSDIDLICLFDETRFDPVDFATARRTFSQAVRGMCATLSDINSDGYVFRTDLRLRPDPAVTPVAMGMEAAERYYESLGRTWERAAYIKARPCAGDLAAGTQFLETLKPFVWRKHLDFAAIQDAHDMRLAIREAKRLSGPITLPGHDMKLGRGGIREIEFFTQTRQLIAGGRDRSLRVRGTLHALARLAAGGWVGRDVAENLTDHYRFHRTVEHRVQMVRDAQTHALPKSDEGFAQLAAMMDREVEDLKAELQDRLSQVHSATEDFFAPGKKQAAPELPEEARIDEETLARWRGFPALRSARGAALFERITPMLETRLAATGRPAETMRALERFLSGLPAGVQLFSLFEANPQLVDLLIDILGTSPALGRYLSGNAGVLDAVIGGDFFADWPGQPALEDDLGARLAAETDYETKLDLARRWMKEWHFRIGVHVLRNIITAEEAGEQYSDLARAVLAALWPHVVDQFARRHGPPPGRGAAILGMGSLGSGQLSSSSDLDMIVIYDPEDETMSEGDRPLATRPYYARLTQALITALSARTAEGRLYEVDMRLRPSGNQGPVATSWASFQNYQRNEAWTWEHLALTRASVCAGPVTLAHDIEAFRREVLAQPRVRAKVLAEVAEMRDRIAAAKAPGGVWDAKVGPGRLQDIELIAQASAVLAGSAARDIPSGIEAGRDLGLFDAAEAERLAQAYALQWRVQMAVRLLTAETPDPDALGAAGQVVLCRAAGAETLSEASERLAEAYDSAASIIKTALNQSEGQSR